MLLAIDVGNTNTVFGIYKDEELIGQLPPVHDGGAHIG